MKFNKKDTDYQVVKDIYDLTIRANDQKKFNNKVQRSQKACGLSLIFLSIAGISIMKLVRKLENRVKKLEEGCSIKEE